MNTSESWRYSVSVATGSTHIAQGLRCDDAAACKVITANGKAYLVAAVADGAGSAKLAAEGSSLATATIISLIEDYLSQGGTVNAIDDAKIDGWLERVRAEIQQVAANASLPGLTLTMRDFSTTLLFAVVADDHTVVCQIGDGAVVIEDPEDRWRLAFEPQKGPLHWAERRSFTNFVTSDRYEQKRQFARFNRRVGKVALFTDGVEHAALEAYGLKTLPGSYRASGTDFYDPTPRMNDREFLDANSFVRDDFFDNGFKLLAGHAGGGLSEAVSQSLKDFLDSETVLKVTGDDKSLILASRPG